jgi:hypothetical protein
LFARKLDIMGDNGAKADRPTDMTDVIVPDNDQNISYIKGLLANGQVAKPKPDGSLEPGVTHEIIGEAPNGLPIVRRRRFSAF